MVDDSPDKRSSPRTHLFVAVTLSWSASSAAARLRNISSDGALVEIAEGPTPGERVKLRRAELSATGTVMWAVGNRVGIRFERPVRVLDWLPAGAQGQQRVDRTFQELKSAPRDAPSPLRSPLPPSPLQAAELAGIADMLDALADALSEDHYVVAKYAEKLQVLDLVSQHLRRITKS